MANTTTTKVNRLGLTHRQTVMIVLLLVGTFVTVLNQTVVAPALPSIMVDMSINAATVQKILQHPGKPCSHWHLAPVPNRLFEPIQQVHHRQT